LNFPKNIHFGNSDAKHQNKNQNSSLLEEIEPSENAIKVEQSWLTDLKKCEGRFGATDSITLLNFEEILQKSMETLTIPLI